MNFVMFVVKIKKFWLDVRSAPDLGGAPIDQGPHHNRVFSHMYDICVPLSHFY